MDVVGDHRQACDAFTVIVDRASGHWEQPSPCSEWTARGVVEHVIGFHDVLLLVPLDAKPTRPKDDPVERWRLSVDAIFGALARPGALDDRASLLGVLTTDVLVHSWDLAQAIGVETSLDPRLCDLGLTRALAHREQIEQSGMFAGAVPVPDDADVQARLLGLFGRNPRWEPPR
jgi:uncharacterized protein (TIGR03086 family)